MARNQNTNGESKSELNAVLVIKAQDTALPTISADKCACRRLHLKIMREARVPKSTH